jgi:hypothetical protein
MCTKLNMTRDQLVALQKNAYSRKLAVLYIMQGPFANHDHMQPELDKWSKLNRFFLDLLYSDRWCIIPSLMKVKIHCYSIEPNCTQVPVFSTPPYNGECDDGGTTGYGDEDADGYYFWVDSIGIPCSDKLTLGCYSE